MMTMMTMNGTTDLEALDLVDSQLSAALIFFLFNWLTVQLLHVMICYCCSQSKLEYDMYIRETAKVSE